MNKNTLKSAHVGSADTFFKEYNSIACFPMLVAVMLLGKHIQWERV